MGSNVRTIEESTTRAVDLLRGPARDPLKTYRVIIDGEVGRVEVPLAHAIQGA